MTTFLSGKDLHETVKTVFTGVLRINVLILNNRVNESHFCNMNPRINLPNFCIIIILIL